MAPDAIIDHPLIAAEAERDEAAETATQEKERPGDRESRGPRG